MSVKLEKFQEDASNAVVKAFKNGRNRYLIADETGLGKTIIARQVIEDLSKRKDKEFFIVYYFGSNLMLLDNTLNDKLGKGTSWVIHNEPKKLGMMFGRRRESGVNIYGFSGNLIGESKKSTGDDKEERPYYTKCLRCIADKIAAKPKLLDAIKHYIDKVKGIKQKDKTELYGFLEKKRVKDGEDITNLRKLFERFSLDKNPPDLMIFDEFHRYDEKLWDILNSKDPMYSGFKWPKILFLSATPYNFYPNVDGGDVAENEDDGGKKNKQKIRSFEKLLKLLDPSDVVYNDYQNYLNGNINNEDFSRILKENCIYRNERLADKDEKYCTLPSPEDIINFMDCYREEKSINAFSNSRYWKMCSGVYSFPIKVYNEKEPVKELYDKLDKLDAEDDLFVFDNNEKLKRNGFYWKNLRFKCIEEYNAKYGRKMLWVPPTMPEYNLGGAFKEQPYFSKLMVFSAYKMVPRIISGVFSAYVSDDIDSAKEIDLASLDKKMLELWGEEKLNHLAQLYSEAVSKFPEKKADISDIKKTLSERIRKDNKEIEESELDLTVNYIIGSPYMCAIREYGIEESKTIKDAFNIYFKKEGIKQAIAYCKITKPEELLDYCIEGGLNATLKEYKYAGGSAKDLQAALVYGSGKGINGVENQGNDCSQVHVYSSESYNNDFELDNPFIVKCHYAERFNADYTDTGRSETTPSGQIHFKNCHNAFNSPFWPMILCTTSANQEGYDLDRYCCRIMHYSLPKSTMAFEQRDGRIDRRLSLLARRRMVHLDKINGLKHLEWDEVFGQEQYQGESGMSPFWTQMGYLETCKEKNVDPIKLERIVPYFPMTPEFTYYRRLLEQKNKYRGKFGMPNESGQGITQNEKKPLKLNDI